MYKIYFRQSIQMIRQNLFMSMIAILGTALAIMMIMSIIVSEKIKTVPHAPEIYRDRTFYMNHTMESLEENGNKSFYYSNEIPMNIFQNYLADMKTPEIISLITAWGWEYKIPVNRINSNTDIPATIRFTDAAFWQIYSFSFTKGYPFSSYSCESGLKEAVITESTANKLFQGEEALGESIEINEIPYRITGIVKDVSGVFSVSYGDIWIPYRSQEDWQKMSFEMILLAHNKKDYPTIIEEVRNAERKYFSEKNGWVLTLRDPQNHQTYMRKPQGQYSEEIAQDLKRKYRKRNFTLFLLLLIPAINLAGLSLSRIKKRTEEIGIRKAFGAKQHIIMIQVLFENLITSLIGGGIGLILAYGVILKQKEFLLGIPGDQAIPIHMLLSFPVLLTVCIICIVINLLSAGLPAWRASRLTIINSINQNDKTL